ncbi:MAG TPA: GNAT family N-acetyltransferase [Euzebyales bacterium]|nr:GNAT family N-acetyltransferase [Euzebyales bacterium]
MPSRDGVTQRRRHGRAAALEVHTALGPFREQWDAMVAAAPVPPVDWRSWWIEGSAVPQTRFLLVLEDGRLLGGLAVEQRSVLRVPLLRLAGHDQHVADCDILAAAGAEDTVVECLRAWFRSLGGCLVDFNGVRCDPLLGRILPPGVGQRAHALGGAPLARLADGFDAYLRRRSSSWRSNYRRNARRLGALDYHHRRLESSEVEIGLTALRRLHGQRFTDGSDFLPSFERFAAAARIGSRRGELAFHVLARGDHIIAVNAVVEVGSYWSYYQGGRNTEDPRFGGAGTVLLGKIIEDGCIRGAHSLDLGLRTDTYKLRMADEVRCARRLTGGIGWAAPVAHGAGALRRQVPRPAVKVLRSARRTVRRARLLRASRR